MRTSRTPKLLTSLAMFVAAYFPLAVIFVVHDVSDSSWSLQHPVACVIVGITMATCIVVSVKVVYGFAPHIRGTIMEASSKSTDMFSYSLPYLTSLGGFTFSDWRDVAATLIVLALMFALAYRTRTIFLNPVLALAGFSLYEGKLKLDCGEREQHVMFICRSRFSAEGKCVVERLAHHIYFVEPVREAASERLRERTR